MDGKEVDTKQTNGKKTDEMDADKNWAASNPESEMGDKQKGKKKKIIIASCCTIAVLVIALVLFLVLGRNRLSAVTMRILRYEGIVTLFDNGKENALMENMLLHILVCSLFRMVYFVKKILLYYLWKEKMHRCP